MATANLFRTAAPTVTSPLLAQPLSAASSPKPSPRRQRRRRRQRQQQLSRADYSFLLVAIFLVGCAYGLESQVRLAYQPYAVASFRLHSSLSTINVLRSVVSVVAQPAVSKVADVAGRLEVFAASAMLYAVGIAVEVGATSVALYYVGSVVYQVGYVSVILLMEVLIADYSSMRARVFLSYIPALPFLLSTWVGGIITSAVLGRGTWRLGIGMWAFIFPAACVPLLVMLCRLDRRGNDDGSDSSVLADNDDDDDDDINTETAVNPKANNRPLLANGLGQACRSISHQIDLIGLLMLMAAFSLVLAPLTSAGGTVSHWRDPTILIALALGICCIPAFVLWERRGATVPFVPFHLLVDRGVWAALGVRTFLNFAWSAQGTYLYTMLVVAFDFPVETATRIMSFFSFFGVLSGLVAGLVIYKMRKLKYVIVLGTLVFSVAFVILIAFPGGASERARSGIIGAQVLLGLASGLFAYPTQASIQASASRENVATMTGLYLSFYNVGSALGTCLSGAIWTQTLYPTLEHNLAFQPNASLARATYESPFAVIVDYPVGTATRSAIIASYREVQTWLCTAGLCLCIPMVLFSLALRNPRLSERQIQPEAEEHE